MTEVCEKSEGMRELAEDVIRRRKELELLREGDIRIGYEMSSKDKKKGGHSVFGECRKVPEHFRPWVPYDFVIIFYEPNVSMLDDKQREVLMLHELLHIGVSPTGNYKIVPHDVEDFSAILDEYGLDWALHEVGDMSGTG